MYILVEEERRGDSAYLEIMNRLLLPYHYSSRTTSSCNHKSRVVIAATAPLNFLAFFSSANSTSVRSSVRSQEQQEEEDFYDSLLRSCNDLNTLKQIQSTLFTRGLLRENGSSPHLGAQIITKYTKFGHLSSARFLFNAVAGSNSFIWNTMIRAYANTHDNSPETLHLYLLMRRIGIGPNNYTFPFVLKACASTALVFLGKSVHGDAIRTGFDSDMYVEAALVDMYAKCGQMDDGRRVFDGMGKRDIVSWTAMITAMEQSERAEEALFLFHQMQDEGFVADSVTIVSVASAVAQLGDAKRAKSIHAHAIRNGFMEEDLVIGNSIVSMYAKCGNVDEARIVFDKMLKRKDGISWNSMLSGYVQNGHASEALLLFDQMQVSGVAPNSVTALVMVSACAHLGSPHLGKKMHDFIIDSGIRIETTLWNAILDMYAKCGDLDTAVEMFYSSLPGERNVSSWNVIMSAYGMHGHGKEALQLFSMMQDEGVEPNHITFTSLLSACSHAGLVNEGRKCFEDMTKSLVIREVKHYACMVDMLGRAGFMDEAVDLINKMPLQPNDGVWGALLLACRIHGNTQLGELAAKKLFELEPEHTGYYVLMSNIYAASNKWQQVGRLRQDMKGKGMKKPTAFSVIELGKEVYGFHTADQVHPLSREIHEKVNALVIEMKMAGYVPDRSCVLHDVEEEDKDHLLNTHSEKLAVAFGIMMINPGLPIQITKNLRVCNDCHSAFKFISYAYQRKIVVRDANRFHHFQDGSCSCQDYW